MGTTPRLEVALQGGVPTELGKPVQECLPDRRWGSIEIVLVSIREHEVLLRVAKVGVEESARGKELYRALRQAYARLTKDLGHAGPRARARRAAGGERTLTELIERFGKSWARGVRKVVTYLENGKVAWPTFLRPPGVEPTYNRAERSIRKAVVIRKIIGTQRNSRGVQRRSRDC